MNKDQTEVFGDKVELSGTEVRQSALRHFYRTEVGEFRIALQI